MADYLAYQITNEIFDSFIKNNQVNLRNLEVGVFIDITNPHFCGRECIDYPFKAKFIMKQDCGEIFSIGFFNSKGDRLINRILDSPNIKRN